MNTRSCDHFILTLTYVIARGVAAMALGLLQRDDLEGSQWCGSRLSGDHASKASHCPRPHVVIVGAHCNANAENRFFSGS